MKIGFVRYCSTVFLLFLSIISPASALESIELSIDKISAEEWQLEHAILQMNDIGRVDPQFALQSAALRLPPPFDALSGLQIGCRSFQWRENYLQCRQGQGRIVSESLASPSFVFSFQVKDQQGIVQIDDLSLFGGKFSIRAKEKAGRWNCKIDAKNVKVKSLQSFFKWARLQSATGSVDLQVEVKGERTVLLDVIGDALMQNLTLQNRDGKIATEELTLISQLSAVKRPEGWQWQSQHDFLQGATYIEPLFLQLEKKQPVTLSASGKWLPENDAVNLNSVSWRHPSIVDLSGSGVIIYRNGFELTSEDLTVHSTVLETASPIYLSPFLEGGKWAGIDLAGQASVKVSIDRNKLTSLQLSFDHVNVDDAENRFQIRQAAGRVDWRNTLQFTEVSEISWKQLKLKAIPFGAGRISFLVHDKQFNLQQPTDVPMLDGVFSVKRFSYAAVANEDADVHFEGAIKRLSMAQLSKALDWTPLSGEISGKIPGVVYRNKKLELQGALKIQVFDGEVTIKKLASSGLFSDFSQIYADIDVDNLDLDAITSKFEFGNIQGRLSGYAHNVYLENWQPVSFYAWLGTPDNDDSRHRISQKAVENIASIGGGGAADLISKGFLGLFDTFGYDKLGFGCYLNQGVCQMMGVASADNGYYLIKGGGLPRIDVIGYNPRLDWTVLMQRLRRIIDTDEVVFD